MVLGRFYETILTVLLLSAIAFEHIIFALSTKSSISAASLLNFNITATECCVIASSDEK